MSESRIIVPELESLEVRKAPEDVPARANIRAHVSGVFKALSLTEPWATLCTLIGPDGLARKQWETRSWPIRYSGWVAIHASKKMPWDARMDVRTEPFRSVLEYHGITDAAHFSPTLGHIIGVVYLSEECYPTTTVRAQLKDEGRAHELAFGNYADGRWAIRMRNAVRLAKPVAAKGALGLWTVPANLEAEVVLQARVA